MLGAAEMFNQATHVEWETGRSKTRGEIQLGMALVTVDDAWDVGQANKCMQLQNTSFRSSDACVTKTKITELKLHLNEIYNSTPIFDGLWFLYDRPIPAARYCRFVSNFDQMQIMTHREGATFQCVAKLWNTRKLLTARILEEHSEKCLLAAMLYNKYNVIR